MKNERKEEIRQEDRKWSWKFALIIVASLFVGALAGAGMGLLEGIDSRLLDWLSGCAAPLGALGVLWLTLIAAIVIALVNCRQAKALAQTAGSTDSGWELVDRKQNAALTAAAVQVVVVYTCFGITAAGGMQAVRADLLDPIPFLIALALDLLGLVFSLVSGVAIQRWVVNTIKEQNPEKRGSVFQVNFNKVWLKSCDEAELSQIYRAGFQAYRAGHYACLAVWLVTVLAGMIGWLNWGTILAVGVIWLVLQITYCVSARQNGNQAVAI